MMLTAGIISGPLEQLQNTINTMKERAIKANKDPNSFKVILLTYPQEEVKGSR